MTDPYAALGAALHPSGTGQALGGWTFGTVERAGRGELLVTCLGLSLDREGVHVPPELSYTWTEDNGSDGLLRAGDTLLVLVSADQQDYYILRKAVWQ
ncbi:hypothetical protein B5E80_17535 [Flavonifractor sp. An135]|nr:hypothetical protein [Flavonifractor sp. An135]OUQ19101.1 hypothetical protein B5E80_17535 [Flavonifractor sp. An135]